MLDSSTCAVPPNVADRESDFAQQKVVGEAHPTKARRGREWSPTEEDLEIYHWVRFEGKTQISAADGKRISQPTVSRIVKRVERWKAHAADRADGDLDQAERLRVQRWLTFERNELMLASMLRIAREIEGFTEVSSSVIQRPVGEPQRANEIRTTSSVLDRTGQVARFVRLAYRINMDQYKLAKEEAAPRPAPLSAEDVATEREAADQAEREFAEDRERVRQENERSAARIRQELAEERAASERVLAERKATQESDAAWADDPAAQAYEAEIDAAIQAGEAPPNLAVAEKNEDDRAIAGPTLQGEAIIHEVNNVNTPAAAKTAVTSDPPCTCAAEEQIEKICGEACIGAASASTTRPTAARSRPPCERAKPQKPAIASPQSDSPTKRERKALRRQRGLELVTGKSG
jgi:hypothetical protein